MNELSREDKIKALAIELPWSISYTSYCYDAYVRVKKRDPVSSSELFHAGPVLALLPLNFFDEAIA
jgi:hypothetical protein